MQCYWNIFCCLSFVIRGADSGVLFFDLEIEGIDRVIQKATQLAKDKEKETRAVVIPLPDDSDWSSVKSKMGDILEEEPLGSN